VSAFDAYMELQGNLDGDVYCDELMARHTSYRIGGPAALYIECASIHDLGLALQTITNQQLPWAIIGKGSNLLISDAGFTGAILTLTTQFRDFALPDAITGQMQQERSQVTSPSLAPNGKQLLVAGSGVMLSNLVQAAFKNGLSGFEFAVGIPGTLGGALAMNAGSATEWIGSIVQSLTVYRPGHGLLRLQGNELPWNYRNAGLPAADIIVESELWVQPGHTGQIRAKMEASLKRRKKTQPLNKPSAGSVFRNPADASAGMLIESLGLKGFTIGGAQVSEVHANFIVNNGSATAADVLAIILEVRRRVKEEYGQELQTEIRFIGFDA
jgi:UDP-N-acetylmuramate dehydrogenase